MEKGLLKSLPCVWLWDCGCEVLGVLPGLRLDVGLFCRRSRMEARIGRASRDEGDISEAGVVEVMELKDIVL